MAEPREDMDVAPAAPLAGTCEDGRGADGGGGTGTPDGPLAGPLRRAQAPVTVRWLERTAMGEADRVAPHRHDYHELIWIRDGSGRHLVDGEPVEAGPGTITLIGRGRVHRFDEAVDLTGAVVDVSDEALFADSAGERDGVGGSPSIGPAWLLVGGTAPTVDVPPSRVAGLEGLLRSLDDEARRPPDVRSADLQRHLLGVLLLWLDRWHEDGSPREATADRGRSGVHARFARVLERDHVRHHDAAHYADALAMPQAALAQALHAATGRTTKELVLDRVMLEATRLLRFTDLAVGQVAHRCGYADPLYFSRAFKRHEGRSPAAYRAAVRGAGPVAAGGPAGPGGVPRA